MSTTDDRPEITCPELVRPLPAPRPSTGPPSSASRATTPTTRFWTCLTCGALIGPMRKHRDLHDEWHDRHGD